MLTAHVGCGAVLLLVLGFAWFVAEHHGWCIPWRDDNAYNKCIGLTYESQDRVVFRLWVPLLTAAWVFNGWWMIRKREAGCLTVLITATVLAALFFLLVILG